MKEVEGLVEALLAIARAMEGFARASGEEGAATEAATIRQAAAEIEALRADSEPAIWVVGDSAFPSEAEAIEEVRQWGPSGAIVRAYYDRPGRDGFEGVVDCCDAKGCWLVLTDEATDITKGQRVALVPIDAAAGGG